MGNLEDIKNALWDMDNDLMGAEVAIEKEKIQSVQLCEDFSIETADAGKVLDWDKHRVMSEILLDYAVEAEKEIKAVRKTWSTLWNQLISQQNNSTDAEKDYKKQVIKMLDRIDERKLKLVLCHIKGLLGAN